MCVHSHEGSDGNVKRAVTSTLTHTSAVKHRCVPGRKQANQQGQILSLLQLFVDETGWTLVSESLIPPLLSSGVGGKGQKEGNSRRLRDGFSGTGDNFMQ